MGAIKALQTPPRDIRRKEAEERLKGKKRREDQDSSWGRQRKREDRRTGVWKETQCLVEELGVKKNKIEKWKRIFKNESNWERKIRQEIEIVVRKDCDEERKRQAERVEERHEVIVYSDASKGENGVGAAVVRIDLEGKSVREKKVNLGKEMEIGDAEMVGIREAVKLGVESARNSGRKLVTVRSDSKYAILRTVAREATKGEMLAEQIRWECDSARAEGIAVKLEWVKAHVGIQGNTIADRLAKEATLDPTSRHAFTSFAFLEASSRQKVVRDWESSYQEARNLGRQGVGRQYTNSPASRHKARFPSDERTARTITTRLRTGHIDCAEYLYRIGKAESEKCECGAPRESVKHALLECPFTATRRGIIQRELGTDQDLTLDDILYPGDPRHWTWGALVWREFKRKRSRVRKARGAREANAGREGEDREDEWGWGICGKR